MPDGHRIPVRDGIALGRGTEEQVGVDITARLAPHKGVSRLHAWVGQQDDAVLVLDLGSRNGTWIDGLKLDPFKLKRFEPKAFPLRVRLGAHVAVVVMEGGTE